MEQKLREMRVRHFELVYRSSVVNEFSGEPGHSSFKSGYETRTVSAMTPGSALVHFARSQVVDKRGQIVSPREKYWAVDLEVGAREVTSTVSISGSVRAPHVLGPGWVDLSGTLWVPWVFVEDNRVNLVTVDAVILRVHYERASWDERVRSLLSS